MRALALTALLILPVALAGCDGPSQALAVGAAGASVAIFHRTPIDMIYSSATGRNCSIVNWDRGQPYCKRPEPEPATPPYCTRSLGVVDCWSAPWAMRNLPPQVADGPRALTPAQERDRTAGWLNL